MQVNESALCLRAFSSRALLMDHHLNDVYHILERSPSTHELIMTCRGRLCNMEQLASQNAADNNHAPSQNRIIHTLQLIVGLGDARAWNLNKGFITVADFA
jgi:hypothetical protein